MFGHGSQGYGSPPFVLSINPAACIRRPERQPRTGAGIGSPAGEFVFTVRKSSRFPPMIRSWSMFLRKAGGCRAVSTAEPKMSFNARVAEFLYRVRRRIATALAVALAIFLGYHVIAGR